MMVAKYLPLFLVAIFALQACAHPMHLHPVLRSPGDSSKGLSFKKGHKGSATNDTGVATTGSNATCILAGNTTISASNATTTTNATAAPDLSTGANGTDTASANSTTIGSADNSTTTALPDCIYVANSTDVSSNSTTNATTSASSKGQGKTLHKTTSKTTKAKAKAASAASQRKGDASSSAGKKTATQATDSTSTLQIPPDLESLLNSINAAD